MKLITNLSCHVYGWLLFAYPSAFRREYGPHMQQVFRDWYRDESARRPSAILNYWLRTLFDLVITAPKEHGEKLRKETGFMSTLRRDIVALLGCIAIIAIAFALHRYVVAHGAPWIVGFVLDAFVTAGVLGNLVVFLLVKLTKRNSLRIALWTFVIVHVLLVSIIAILGPNLGQTFSLGPVVVGYVISFALWFGLHWAWHLSKRELVTPN